MVKRIFLFLVVIVFFINIINLITLISALSPGNLSSCGEINESGIYVLNETLEFIDFYSYGCLNISQNNVILDCQGYQIRNPADFSDQFSVGSVNKNNLTVKNCNFYHANYGFSLFLENNSNILIQNNTLSSRMININIINSLNATIINNIFDSAFGYGVYINYSYNINVTSNNFTSLNNPIYLFSCNQSNFINNYFFDNFYGIESYYSNENNLFSNSFYYGYYNIYMENGNNNQIKFNLFNGTGDLSLFLSRSSFNNITYNNLSSSETGIRLSNSTINNLLFNNANYNQKGLVLMDSGNNTLRSNNFSNNMFDIYLASEPDEGWGYYGLYQDIDLTNVISGNKKIYINFSISNYVFDKSSTIDPGMIICTNCNNITIKDINLTSRSNNGLHLFNLTNSLIFNISSSNHDYGAYIYSSENINISSNNFYGNFYGLQSYISQNNQYFLNNFINNSFYGLIIAYGGYNRLEYNNMSNNQFNFLLYGQNSIDYDNNISKTNLLEGFKPIYYNYSISDVIYDTTSVINPGLIYCIDCHNITLKDFKINSTKVIGIYLFNVSNSVFFNLSFENLIYGIILEDSINNNITNNIFNSMIYSLSISGSQNDFISFNYFNNSEEGLLLSDCYNDTIFNNTLYNLTRESLSLDSSNDNYFFNNLVMNSMSVSIFNSHNNSFFNNIYSNLFSASLSLDYSMNNIFMSETINSSIDYDLSFDETSNNTFLNCTFNETNIDYNFFSNQFYRSGYYRAKVNDSSTGLSEVTVTVINVSGATIFTTTTDANGYTPLMELIEYSNFNGNKSYYSNYTITVSKTGYTSSTRPFNATLEHNNYYHSFNLSLIPINNDDDDDGDSGGGNTGSMIPSTAVINPWKVTYIILEKDFKNGTARNLLEKERLNYKLNNLDHYVGVFSLTSTKVTIHVFSTPQIADLNIGESKKFDVNLDGYYDIIVTLNTIVSNKANLFIKSINEKIPEAVIAPIITPENNQNMTNSSLLPTTTENSKSKAFGIILLIIFFIILLSGISVVAFYLYKLQINEISKKDTKISVAKRFEPVNTDLSELINKELDITLSEIKK